MPFARSINDSSKNRKCQAYTNQITFTDFSNNHLSSSILCCFFFAIRKLYTPLVPFYKVLCIYYINECIFFGKFVEAVCRKHSGMQNNNEKNYNNNNLVHNINEIAIKVVVLTSQFLFSTSWFELCWHFVDKHVKFSTFHAHMCTLWATIKKCRPRI